MQGLNADLALAYQNYYANTAMSEEIQHLPTMNQIPFPNIVGDTQSLLELGMNVVQTHSHSPKHSEDVLISYDVTYKGWSGVVERKLDPDAAEGVLLTKTFSDGEQTLTKQVDLTYGVLPYSRWDRLRGEMDNINLLEVAKQSFDQVVEALGKILSLETTTGTSSLSHRKTWHTMMFQWGRQEWSLSLGENQEGVLCLCIKNESLYDAYEAFYGDGNAIHYLSLDEMDATEIIAVMKKHEG